MDIMDIRTIFEVMDIMDIMNIINIMDIMDNMIITAWLVPFWPLFCLGLPFLDPYLKS